MSRAETIYPIQKGLERERGRFESDPFNRDILARYYKVRLTEVKPTTVLGEFIRLNELSRTLAKKFEEATREDIEDLVYNIDQKKNHDNTKNKYRKVLKAFYRWLRGCARNEYPPEVKWIMLKKIPLVTVTADDLPSYEECIRITEHAQYPRDKALFQCKLDAGCRIGEILTVKIGEVKFNDGGAILYSDGKTGYQPIILTWSAKSLAQWLNVHPFKHDKEAPVFSHLMCRKPTQMKYSAAAAAFKKCVKRAGCDRRVWLHLLKHVSSTEDAARGMPDSYRRFKHHWTANSKMSQVYEHLSASVIPNIQNDGWKRFTGHEIASNPEKKEVILLKDCRRCQFANPRDSSYCNRCGFVLDEHNPQNEVIEKSKLELLFSKLARDPDKVEKLLALVE